MPTTSASMEPSVQGEVVQAEAEKSSLPYVASGKDVTTSDRDKTSSPAIPSPGSSGGRRGRSRVRGTPAHDDHDRDGHRRGYHSLMSSFGKVFHVEKRWKLIREMGSGAYGFVISAADEISGEPVAIKLVTRASEKMQLAKRALREITLLRFFNHENITGLIDVDCSPDLSEIYIFMEPMEADLHQIIKSRQGLTNEHIQYFVYQILRGMKYIHSASVVHRDLKPGNILVNADCELKICDFGLSRGFNRAPDEPTVMTEYVATRWYRAPEIMLAFKAYNTAIDVWSIGCILAELILGRPFFKGKDYVDQLNKILDVLGTPDDEVLKRIGSDKAQAYIRQLPFKETVPFEKLLPTADPQALDLLGKMLTFDPSSRISVADALEHPWLSSYHDVSDEPECHAPFDRWQEVEALVTLEEFRDALRTEIMNCRREVRSVGLDKSGQPTRSASLASAPEEPGEETPEEPTLVAEETCPLPDVRPYSLEKRAIVPVPEESNETKSYFPIAEPCPTSPPQADPVVTYARRSSFMQPSRTNSMYSTSAFRTNHHVTSATEHTSVSSQGDGNSVVFPTGKDYVVPARSRTGSMFSGSEGHARRLLRTLSTVSIYESGEGHAGGLADIAPIGKFIGIRDDTADKSLASALPREFDDKTEVKGSGGSEKTTKFRIV